MRVLRIGLMVCTVVCVLASYSNASLCHHNNVAADQAQVTKYQKQLATDQGKIASVCSDNSNVTIYYNGSGYYNPTGAALPGFSTACINLLQKINTDNVTLTSWRNTLSRDFQCRTP